MADNDDNNNSQNMSDEELNEEIEMREYMLTMPSRNLSMQNIIHNRLNLLLAEQRRRQWPRKRSRRTKGGRNARKNKKSRKNKNL
jgi:hypothetical protein